MYVYRNIEARSCNRCWSGKAIIITYSECVPVALSIQHAKRMRRIILSSVARVALLYFPTLPHKRHDFRGGGGEGNVFECVFWLSAQCLSEIFLILTRTERYMIKNVYCYNI